MPTPSDQMKPETSKREFRKHKWERIGIIASIVAVIGTLGFSVWDKIDYRLQREMDRKQLEIDRKQFEMNIEQIEKTSYDKLYSDVSKGLLNSTKLANAIDIIIENGDDLSGMDLSEKWLPELQLPDNINMYRINLTKAYMPKSLLRFVNLKTANLEKADLMYANLEGTKYLTIKQLSKVKTLYQAKIDSVLMKQVKEKYPHLLEKPKP